MAKIDKEFKEKQQKEQNIFLINTHKLHKHYYNEIQLTIFCRAGMCRTN